MWEDFERVDLTVGSVTRVEDFPEAKKSSYKLWIDFGELGTKRSGAQITTLYRKEELIGRQVICVTNFPPKQVVSFISEVLTTGFILGNREVVLSQPERELPNGFRLA